MSAGVTSSLGAALSRDSLITSFLCSTSAPAVCVLVCFKRETHFLHCLRLLLGDRGVNRSQWYLRIPCERIVT